MYVELSNTIEGMIRINSIPGDYFDYDEKNYRLVGRRTGKNYTLGQKVEVVVLNSDPALRQIDFELKT